MYQYRTSVQFSKYFQRVFLIVQKFRVTINQIALKNTFFCQKNTSSILKEFLESNEF